MMRFLSASETTNDNDDPSTMYSTENTSSFRESLETTARVLEKNNLLRIVFLLLFS